MGKYPGWRTMTAAQRYNARYDKIFEDARRRGDEQHAEPALAAACKAGRSVARIELGLRTIRNTYATLHERTAFDDGYFAELRRAKEENGT